MVISSFVTSLVYSIAIVFICYLLGYFVYRFNKIVKSFKKNKVYNSYIRVVKEPIESHIDLFYLEERESIESEWKFIPNSYSYKYGEILEKKEQHVEYLKIKDNINKQNKTKWILQKLKTVIVSI